MSLIFASLLVIRGRAVIIGVFLSIVIFIIFFLKNRKYKVWVIVSALLLLSLTSKYIYEALFLNYDVSNINSLSTGRFTRVLKGLDYFFKNPLGGQLINRVYKGHTIHNYLLFNLVNYGVLFSTPLLIIYFNYIFKVISAIKRNSFNYFELAPLTMIILIVVSLFEYTYPYAPGSSILLPFFLLGHYHKKQMLGRFAKVSKPPLPSAHGIARTTKSLA